MFVKRVVVRDIITENAYFYIDEITKHGFLIDPGAEPEKLSEMIAQNGWIIEKILLTHSHFDHIGGVQELSTAIPYYIHKNGAEYLKNPDLNLSTYCNRHIVLEKANYLNDGDTISLLSQSANPPIELRILHTPGHTPDSSIYYDAANGLTFVGDTIFRGGVGTTEYTGGNADELRLSLARILGLPGDVVLYPGHGRETNVLSEKHRYGLW